MPSICLDKRVSEPDYRQLASIGFNQPRLASIDASGKRRAWRARCIFAQTDCKIRCVRGWQVDGPQLDLKPPGFTWFR
ncbi:MAG: hypothetical protein CBCREVIR_0503 [Candidatus Burkholderia crenata]|nr:MAG: hypothetical protein CBCREVIR_0503 [Candidatus Burkholderia crenata]